MSGIRQLILDMINLPSGAWHLTTIFEYPLRAPQVEHPTGYCIFSALATKIGKICGPVPKTQDCDVEHIVRKHHDLS